MNKIHQTSSGGEVMEAAARGWAGERGGGGGAGVWGGGVAEVVTLVTAETSAAETQVM